MYYFYMGKVLLPIPPSKIQTTVNNQNKTINLMNEGEVNVIKSPGLTEFKFDILLPLNTYYPFAMYNNKEFLHASYFLDYFKKLKNNRTPFFFVINRYKYDPQLKAKANMIKTRMEVILESYTITEATDSAPDIEVSIELKEYVKYETIVKDLDSKTNTVMKSSKINGPSHKTIPNTYVVKKGDTLWVIAKKLLGDGAKCWNLAKLNGISNPNKLTVGQVLKIQDVKATVAPPSAKSNTSSVSAIKTVKTVTPAAKKSSKIPKSAFLFADSNGVQVRNTLSKFYEGKGRSSGGGGISNDGHSHSGGSRGF
ncbi:LysM peptidoglycan-binding domain-containing protein [Anaerocolumna jejuensis]|uniref:LysM peptidoglycan-binding domain-containing protein n=1 Tax=Anaerocolumna jejuensis TaxID=259063 RepID=UPI003F7C6869